jgi:hypothetical protein
MREIHRNAYYVLELDAPRRTVWLKRTRAPFEDLEIAAHSHEELRRALTDVPADKLLLDLREGPAGRNDAAFENAIQGTRQEMARRFRRVAVLVRTAAGRLQMQRLEREGRVSIPVFLDEATALDFLDK